MSRSILVLLLAALIALASFTGLQTAYSQGPTVSIQGLVLNGTPGSASSVAGLTVTLHADGGTKHDHSETLVEVDGRFLIDEITYDPTVVYGISVRYQDALYGEDIDLSVDAPPKVLITIYDATDSLDVLSTDSTSILFAAADSDTQTISALEIVRISNESAYTYVPGTEPMNLLRFGLPDGYSDLRVDTRLIGADIVEVDRGFAVLSSVPPGAHDLMFTYEFPYSGTQFTFEKTMRFGADALRILSPAEVLSLSSPELGPVSTVAIGERDYQLIEATNIDDGARISVVLGGLPKQTTRQRLTGSFDGLKLEYAGPIGLAVLLGILVALALVRRGRRSELVSAGAHEMAGGDPSQLERDALRDMITDLEGDFRSGSVNGEEYRRRRRVLETRLASLE
ncbi:MAG: hypothetical protein IIB14_02710 [Chloroflexi bacterium]|nr:hypothetical protein [Chloroflexota bacterium]